LKNSRSQALRDRVAREAALLIYTSQEKELKQAKRRAAETLGARVLPSNREVVEELDKLVEEREGNQRRQLLVQMRREALELMDMLKEFSPRLVGSVWRGTVRRGSDIDVAVYSQEPQEVLSLLQGRGYHVERSEWRSVTKEGRKESSFHIILVLDSGDEAEIVVRSPESLGQPERCETYGDLKTGLSLSQLRDILEKNPLQRFVPA